MTGTEKGGQRRKKGERERKGCAMGDGQVAPSKKRATQIRGAEADHEKSCEKAEHGGLVLVRRVPGIRSLGAGAHWPVQPKGQATGPSERLCPSKSRQKAPVEQPGVQHTGT